MHVVRRIEDWLSRSALCDGLPGTYLVVLMIAFTVIAIVSCSRGSVLALNGSCGLSVGVLA